MEDLAGWTTIGFLQQIAADPSLRWNTLIPGLQATTILGQQSAKQTVFCTLCREVDHMRDQCALVCLQSPDPAAAAVTRSSRPPRTPTQGGLHVHIVEQGKLSVPRPVFLQAYLCDLPVISQSKGLPKSSRLLCLQTASWGSTPAPLRSCANIPPILKTPAVLLRQ